MPRAAIHYVGLAGVGDVVAAASQQGVGETVGKDGVEKVVARPAGQAVGAAGAVYAVVAAQAVDDVVAAPALYAVGLIVARQVVRGGTARDVLDVGLDVQDVLDRLKTRDERDSTEGRSTLEPPNDAVPVDTTGRPLEEVIDQIVMLAIEAKEIGA